MSTVLLTSIMCLTSVVHMTFTQLLTQRLTVAAYVVVALWVGLVLVLLGLGGTPTVEVPWQHQAPHPVAVQAPMSVGADAAGEEWWTTTDCPAGVPVPCLDPAAEGAGPLPAHVYDQLQRLDEARWSCLSQVGVPWSASVHGGVRVSHEVAQVCESYAYLSVARDQHPAAR